jgi:hypothetical protein
LSLGQVPQRPNRLGRHEARPQQPSLKQLAQPLGVLDVGLASGNQQSRDPGEVPTPNLTRAHRHHRKTRRSEDNADPFGAQRPRPPHFHPPRVAARPGKLNGTPHQAARRAGEAM